LEFNTFNPNWLATGGEDGELNIWDLTKPGQPSLFPSLKVCINSHPCLHASGKPCSSIAP
jgi:WD40 repeat protein